MKLLIIADMEGASGIVHPEQTSNNSADYKKGREWLMSDINSAIKGAYEAGVKSFIVNDGHGNMRNILPDMLPEYASLISGTLKRYIQAEGLNKNIDGLMLIGFHARMGSYNGVIDHTLIGSVVNEIKVNGKPYGETGLNALIAGVYNVPVILVCGDEAVTKEANNLFKTKPETVAVKKGLSRFAAKCLPLNKTKKMIEQASFRAVQRLKKKEFKPLPIPKKLNIEVELANSGMGDACERIPGVKRISPKRIKFTTDSPLKAHDYIWVILTCARHSANL